VDIDYALLADHADIASGKLYVNGGGWDRYALPQVPGPVRLAVATGIRIGWEETNKPIPVVMVVEDDDGQQLMRIDALVNVGRPAQLPAGSSQLAQVAANAHFQAPRYGGYRVRISAGDEAGNVPVARRSLPFHIVPKQG
jgi:hypothetical protein